MLDAIGAQLYQSASCGSHRTKRQKIWMQSICNTPITRTPPWMLFPCWMTQSNKGASKLTTLTSSMMTSLWSRHLRLTRPLFSSKKVTMKRNQKMRSQKRWQKEPSRFQVTSTWKSSMRRHFPLSLKVVDLLAYAACKILVTRALWTQASSACLMCPSSLNTS